MHYSQFTLRNLVEQFNLTLVETTRLFPDVKRITPTELLLMTLQDSLPLATAINSEKARSELIITPILRFFRTYYAKLSVSIAEKPSYLYFQ